MLTGTNMPTGLATLKFKVVVSELYSQNTSMQLRVVVTDPYGSVTTIKSLPGGYTEGVTPVPIPNTEVKPLRADGT